MRLFMLAEITKGGGVAGSPLLTQVCKGIAYYKLELIATGQEVAGQGAFVNSSLCLLTNLS